MSQIQNLLNKELKVSLKMITGEINQSKVEFILGVAMSYVI
jgi:hypothetical protein